MIKIKFTLTNFSKMMNRHVIEAHLKFSYNNHSEKVVNSILELYLHSNCISKRDFCFFKMSDEITLEFYETKIKVLKQAMNDRLWLKKNMKVRKLYEDDRSTKSLKIFYASCVSHNRLTDDKDNLKMDTQL